MTERIRILLHYLRARWNQQRFPDRQALETWQEKQVQKLLQRILPVSGFYRNHFSGYAIEQWKQVPPVEKSELMAHFDDWNTIGVSLDQAMQVALQSEESRDFSPMIGSVAVGLSSGTSGNRGLFLVSASERQAWSGAMIAKILPDCWKRPERIALFLRANNNLYQALDEGGRVRFRYFDLLAPLETHLSTLDQYRPTVLVGPPSLLRMLADAQHEMRIHLQPKKIVSVAEVLEPLDAAWIGEVFGQTVHQVYQCTEGFLATTCPLGTLHLNEDLVVFEKEYLDKASGKFVPIITDFNRYTQPVLRYRLNDVLTEKQTPCPCGSVFSAIERIEGRCDDLFYFKHLYQDAQVAVFPDFLRRAVMLASPEISEYIIRQVAPEKIEVGLKLSSGTHQTVQDAVQLSLEALFSQQHCQTPEIRFIPYSSETERGKKLRRIQRVFARETHP